MGDLLQGVLVFSDENDVLAPTIDNLSAKHAGTHIFGIEIDNPILLSVAWDSTLGCFFGSLASFTSCIVGLELLVLEVLVIVVDCFLNSLSAWCVAEALYCDHQADCYIVWLMYDMNQLDPEVYDIDRRSPIVVDPSLPH